VTVTQGPGEKIYDVAVIGGGIVGLATAMLLLRERPSIRLVVLEKEPRVARQQSGHNSGVLHTGIYYVPGSLKARTCVEGHAQLRRFCQEQGVEVIECGKLVVAANESELSTLEELKRRGEANGVPRLSLLTPEEMTELEPHVGGVAGLHVPTAAIVDFTAVCERYADTIRASGGEVLTSAKVTGIRRGRDGIVLTAGPVRITARHLVNCGGLHSDRIARAAGAETDIRIVPFRGEYYELREDRRHLVRGLLYPAPRLGMPFLGVHFTPKLNGEVEAGPNAVLALSREGYQHRDVSLADVAAMLRSKSFWRMGGRLWRVALSELHRSLHKPTLVADLRKMVPTLTGSDLVRSGSGVRAQAVDGEGRLVDDFCVVESERALHVLNAPSPAATASLAIARHLVDRAFESFADLRG
jgi:L-2-hydroxyglutarate oxidase